MAHEKASNKLNNGKNPPKLVVLYLLAYLGMYRRYLHNTGVSDKRRYKQFDVTLHVVILRTTPIKENR